MSERLITPQGIVTYHSLVEPSGKSDKYELSLLIPKRPADWAHLPKYNVDLQVERGRRMREEAEDCAKGNFRVKLGEKDERNRVIYSPFRCAGEKDHIDGYDDRFTVVTLKSKYAPEFYDVKAHKTEDGSIFYSGCWAHAEYSTYAYRHDSRWGVSLSLGKNIQKLRDGEELELYGNSGSGFVDESDSSYHEADACPFD